MPKHAMQIPIPGATALCAIMAIRCGGDDPSPPAKPVQEVSAPEAKAALSQAEPVANTENAPRDPRWAQPLEKPGLPNLHQVSDALFRGAQPEPVGFAELKKMGIATIVNLRGFHSDRDEIRAAGLGENDLKYVHIRMHAWNAEDEDIVAFLKIMADKKNHPVFVHCKHGADRTGTMVVIYRIAIQGWSVEDALKEMLHGGFGFHAVWVNLVDYLKNVDLERLKREARLVGSSDP